MTEENYEFENTLQHNNFFERAIVKFFALVFVLAAIVVFIMNLGIEPKAESFRVELGTDISKAPSDYVTGPDFSILRTVLDLSEVDVGKTGEYTAEARFLWDREEFSIVVADTTPPRVIVKDGPYVFDKDEPLEISDIVLEAEDASDNVSVKFFMPVTNENLSYDAVNNRIMFKSAGEYGLMITAVDANMNQTTIPITVTADTRPVIYGDYEYYVALGTQVFPLYYATAYDEEDGVVKASMTVDLSDLYLYEEGVYEATLTATDSMGLSASKAVIVHALDAYRLQDLINTHQIWGLYEFVDGALNPYDSGYIADGDMDLAIKNIEPCVVNIHYEYDSSRVHGSGFVVKITDSEIIIATNEHVVEYSDTVNVSFYDGMTYKASKVAAAKSPDVAFLRITDEEALKNAVNYRTVHINLNYFNEISYTPDFELGCYAINSDGSRWVDCRGNIYQKAGYLSSYFENYDYEITEVSVKLIRGMSGSPIIDEHGNLICMAAFFWDSGRGVEYYGVALPEILDFYEKTFNERLEYY